MIFTLTNDNFIVGLSNVTLTFNLPEQMFQMALLLLKESCAIFFFFFFFFFLKSMHKCGSYVQDKLNL